MGQYFDNDKSVESNLHEVVYYLNNVRFKMLSDNGVFSKNSLDFGTKTLLDTVLKENLSGYGLDLGCGIGVIGISLSVLNPNTVFDLVDINERAVGLAKENSKHYKLDENRVFVSDGLNSVCKKDYDFILTNPPIRAGKKVVYDFFIGSYEHLRVDGALYVVIQKKQGAPSAIAKLTSIFGNCELLERNKGYQILKCVKKT